MWISRKHYDDLRLDTANARGVAQALEKQNIAMQTMMDWLRVRISQIEHERAQLLYNYTGVKISTPVFETQPSEPARDPFHAVPSFEDLGDDAASKLGVGWNPDGTLRFAGSEDLPTVLSK